MSENNSFSDIVQTSFDVGSGSMKQTLGTSLDDVNDSITTYDKCSYVNLAASALVKTGAGQLYGMVVNSHSGAQIILYDNTSGAAPIICNTITLAAGERYIDFKGLTFGTGLYFTLSAGTINATLFYR